MITQYSISQISNGFWQEKTPNVSDSYLGGYHFVNSDFEYTINGYDGLNPVSAFGGKFIIKKGNIIFTITYMKKVIGGQLCRSETCTLNDSWAIEGGKVTKVKLDKAIKAMAKIEIHADYLLIDKQKYFRIEEN
jgi:hypothetical protein